MARRVLYLSDYISDLLVLLSKMLDALVLITILFNVLFHHWVPSNIEEVFLELPGVFVNKRHVFAPNALNHIAHIIAPSCHICLGILVALNSMLSALSELIEFLHGSDVALVDILNIFFADKALKALECLVFA